MSEPSLRELVQLLFKPSAASLWSAFAATFAAVSSFMIMRIHRRNLVEMLRPELMLTDWSRQSAGQGDAAREEITFKIKNVGRGVALNVHLRLLQLDRPVTLLKVDMETMRLSAIANGESVAASSPIKLWWKNIDGDRLVINIPIRCSDTRGSRYETRYNLMISKLSPNIKVSDPMAPGVLGNRDLAIVTPFWKVKWSLQKDRIRMQRGKAMTQRVHQQTEEFDSANLAKIPIYLDRTSMQAALTAGFAFTALTQAPKPLPYWRGLGFVTSAVLAVCLELLVVFTSTLFTLVKDPITLAETFHAELVVSGIMDRLGLFFFAVALVFFCTIQFPGLLTSLVISMVALSVLAGFVLLYRFHRAFDNGNVEP